MALKTSVAVLLSVNLLFFATLSSSSALPPAASTPPPSSCSIDILKLNVCANLLGPGGVSIVVGSPRAQPCCNLINGLVDLEAAVCLCTSIRAEILGIIKANATVDLGIILNKCGKSLPAGFRCA